VQPSAYKQATRNIAGVSGEVFTEIGRHVKRDSLFDRTMMVTVMTNGIGYIPNDKAYLLPSEKAVSNRLKLGCAEPAMVNAFQDLMKQYLPFVKFAEQDKFARDLQDRLGILALLALSAPFRICRLQIPSSGERDRSRLWPIESTSYIVQSG
jgi:hypothetical protein